MSANEPAAEASSTTPLERRLFIATVVLLLLASCAAVALQIPRRLDHDEGEYLHAAWLMSEGQRIYRDFMEDHPPFLYQALNALRPHIGPNEQHEETLAWTLRGRIFVACCGTLAMLAAALVVWRITRNGGAAALTLASLLAGYWVWLRALAEIRADPPTLALFTIGLLLLIWDELPSWRMAWLVGFGIALAIAAEMWNPKWPLEGLCLGAFFLMQTARLARARRAYVIATILPAVFVGGVMLALLTSVTSVRDYLFFNFILKSQNLGGLQSQAWITLVFRQLSPTFFAPDHFVGIVPLVAFAAIVALLIRGWRRMGRERAGRTVLILALVISAAIEVRFVYPWPHLWPQFFVMLAFALSMMYGLLGDAVVRLGAEFRERPHAKELAFSAVLVAAILGIWATMTVFYIFAPEPWTLATVGAALLLSAIPLVVTARRARGSEPLNIAATLRMALIPVALAIGVPSLVARQQIPIVHEMSTSWKDMDDLTSRLRPGDTVWLAASRRPVMSRDASYLWYSFNDLVAMTLDGIATNPRLREYLPALTPRDLPICQLARGEAPSLRLVEVGAYTQYIPGTCQCAQVVLSRPDVIATHTVYVYEVLRPGSSIPPPSRPRGWDLLVRQRLMRCPTFASQPARR